MGKARGEARAYFDLARALLDAAAATPDRHRRPVGQRQVGRRARACAPYRRLPGRGAYQERCRAEAPVRGRPRIGNCLTPPMRKASRIRSMPTCRKRARLALEAGHAVIVDAVHAKPEERAGRRGLRGRDGRGVHRSLARRAARGDAASGSPTAGRRVGRHARGGRCATRLRHRHAGFRSHRRQRSVDEVASGLPPAHRPSLNQRHTDVRQLHPLLTLPADSGASEAA